MKPHKNVLFIDRDGTLIVEPPITEQVNSIEELEFLPEVIRNLAFIAEQLDYELVMVTNQDGLGTETYPLSVFQPIQDLVVRTLASEGIVFSDIYIDPTRAEDNAPTRKPGTAMLTKYVEKYDLANSYVIGDRDTDVQLARNLGCKSILIASDEGALDGLSEQPTKVAQTWTQIAEYLFAGERKYSLHRTTKETDIRISLDLDGNGKSKISTGLHFFDHLLEQISRHGNIDLDIQVTGDLHVDEHHTIEDTAIVLGECLLSALGSKRGIERYGFTLPMDDSLCSVVLDFGGRSWLVWEADFKREKVGDVPTEMFQHFFKSLSDAARMNLNIKAEGSNEHHKIEGIFKAFGKSLRQAVKRDIYHYELPSSKGTL